MYRAVQKYSNQFDSTTITLLVFSLTLTTCSLALCSRPRRLAVLTVFTVWMERIAATIEHSLFEKRNITSSFVTNACGLYSYFGFIHDIQIICQI